ncbi:hypothetical protein DS878_02410 [Marinobacter sp. F3R11]|nr:hypothetical protein DS878_02410 [Marinobacter sp. F3R11]
MQPRPFTFYFPGFLRAHLWNPAKAYRLTKAAEVLLFLFIIRYNATGEPVRMLFSETIPFYRFSVRKQADTAGVLFAFLFSR